MYDKSVIPIAQCKVIPPSMTFILLLIWLLGSVRAAQAAPSQPLADTSEEVVFLDETGKVKVLDPVATGSAPIKWESTESGFYSFALGDFNADGDMEIVAINRTGKQMVIYDPVVASGSNDGQIEGVPWRKLLTHEVTGEPNLIATGNFDTNAPGDEVAIGYEVTGRVPPYRVEILKATSATPDGTSLAVHQTKDFNNIWQDSSVGDVVSNILGAEELILIDPPMGTISVFQMDNGFMETGCRYGSRTDAPPLDVIALQWEPGGTAEIAFTRNWEVDACVTQPRLIVLQCVNNQFKDVYATKYNPTPHKIFAADVTNNGEEELFLLRDLPEDDSRVHFFAENSGNDTIDFATILDADNGFQSGDGGDIDGDGNDEVVIMRDNKIRVYQDPEIGADAVNETHYQDYLFSTNNVSVEIGDLDKNGYQVGFSLIADQTAISATLSSGDILNDAGLFTVKLNNESISKQHNVPTVDGLPSDIRIIFQAIDDSTPGFTPTTYSFAVDASEVVTPTSTQVYSGTIRITSNDPEIGTFLSMPLAITLITSSTLTGYVLPMDQLLFESTESIALKESLSVDNTEKFLPAWLDAENEFINRFNVCGQEYQLYLPWITH